MASHHQNRYHLAGVTTASFNTPEPPTARPLVDHGERRMTVSEAFPPPHPLWWLPVADQRHAIRKRDQAAPTGTPVHTLCGQTFDRPVPPSDAQWLWPTCKQCWVEACKIVGLR